MVRPRLVNANNPTRRDLLLGLGGLAAAGALGACGVPTESEAPAALGTSAAPSAGQARGEITLWMRDDDLLKVFRTVVPAFNAKYPGVKVNLKGVDIATKLPPALVSGTGLPDGSFWEDDQIGQHADHLYDLTALMGRYRDDTVQFKLDVLTHDGRLVGIPWDTDPGLLYYNDEILTGAGVDPASLTDYDALLEAARAIKAGNPKARPIPLEQDNTLGMMWYTMFLNQQQGHGLVDPSGRLTLDGAASRRALTWIKTIVDEGLGARQKFASTAQITMLDDGIISLVPWAIWFIFIPQSGLKKTTGKWRVTGLPAWTPGGARSGLMGGSSFVIPAKAKNPELAWLFYEFAVYDPQGYRTVFSKNSVYPTGLNTVVPSVKSALDPAKPLVDRLPQLGGVDNWAISTKAALDIPAGYTAPSWYGQAAKYLGANIQRLMDGRMSVDEVIAKSTADIQKNLIDRN
ncbi:ABC-type glycerol-3-phosphate transport system substrate-binding protein [Thermocatellispora tengchongensis]|uniref:ABC-type glycerol-3-phosphate transport system substrate-binding protein n=1 Tax=Thermocatellispora tengchongensis TaxID=1073253 RepID=A0A840P7C2_9ACTN|nr:extracellular solute-binding protein [Thermocatellispora tengchongensis]MBB5134486.1 ABC-type glycerol-3-phosphate transport system substrate-binding protein [Thermocatellispora tengchongensis]